MPITIITYRFNSHTGTQVRDVKCVKNVFVSLKKLRKNIFFFHIQVVKHRKAGSPLRVCCADICLGTRSLHYLYCIVEYYTTL